MGWIILLVLVGIIWFWYSTVGKKPSEKKILEGIAKGNYPHLNFGEVQEENGRAFSTVSFDLGFPESTSKVPHTVIVDVETSGLRKFRNPDSSHLSNWPRIVQIAYLVFDAEGNLIFDEAVIFKQPRPLPKDSIAIHGITDERCKAEGVDPEPVLQRLWEYCQSAKALVGHNIEFDYGVIEANMRRFKITESFEIHTICTMKSTSSLLKLPSNFSGLKYKNPTLKELVHYLFFPPGVTVDMTTHDAAYDTAYTARCYFELKKRGIIS